MVVREGATYDEHHDAAFFGFGPGGGGARGCQPGSGMREWDRRLVRRDARRRRRSRRRWQRWRRLQRLLFFRRRWRNRLRQQQREQRQQRQQRGLRRSGGCDASCSGGRRHVRGLVVRIAENPGKVATGTQTQLQGNGTSDAASSGSTPTTRPCSARARGADAAVRRRGPDAEYVHMTSKNLDYKGYFAAGGQQGLNVRSPAEVVGCHRTPAVGAGRRRSRSQVTKVSGGDRHGSHHRVVDHRAGEPARHHLLRDVRLDDLGGGGTDAARHPGGSSPGGGTEHDQPGSRDQGGCGNVCHAASADGSTLVAATTTATSCELRPEDQRVGALRARQHRLHVRRPLPRRHVRHVGDGLPIVGQHRVAALRHEDGREHRGARMGRRHHARRNDRVLAGRQADRLRARGRGRAHAREDGLRRRHQDVLEPRRPRDRRDRLRRLAGVHARRQVGRLPRGSRTRRSRRTARATGDVYMVDIATKTVRRLDSLDGYTGSGHDVYLPANDTEASTSRPPCSPRRWAATSGSSSRATAPTATCSPSIGQQARRPGRQALGRGDRHRRRAGNRREPSRLLSRRAGAHGRQPARLLGAPPVRAERRIGAASGDQCCSGFCRPGGEAERRLACRRQRAARTSTRAARRPRIAATPATSASTAAAPGRRRSDELRRSPAELRHARREFMARKGRARRVETEARSVATCFQLARSARRAERTPRQPEPRTGCRRLAQT